MVRRAVGMGGFSDLDEPAPDNGLWSSCARVCAYFYELVVGEGSA